jgi:site-specific DNA-cytosine methylase
MPWLVKCAVKIIRATGYVFENGPRFMSNAGDYVRRQIEEIAREAGYSLGYYKTDTKWHDNCQIRPRTFIYFFRIDDENRKGTPALGWERKNVSIEEFLNRIPADATQTETFLWVNFRQQFFVLLNICTVKIGVNKCIPVH